MQVQEPSGTALRAVDFPLLSLAINHLQQLYKAHQEDGFLSNYNPTEVQITAHPSNLIKSNLSCLVNLRTRRASPPQPARPGPPHRCRVPPRSPARRPVGLVAPRPAGRVAPRRVTHHPYVPLFVGVHSGEFLRGRRAEEIRMDEERR
jgi:hypothetical protein